MTQDMLGKQIGNYRITAELANGTFGSVYTAKHLIFDDEPVVAVKQLHAHLGSQPERERFLQEARFLRKLKHPYILPLFDAGLYENFLFLIVEYAPNGSLCDRLHRQSSRPVPAWEALAILSQIGQALQYAHDQNIVHRDLKPGNILFNTKDDALLADFGIAVLLEQTKRIEVEGTPSYMAPEQFRGEVSKKSDQYALGCIAYKLLTGRPPFTAPDFISMGYKHVYEQPIPPTQLNPNLPEHIEQAILKAMAKQREDRYIDTSAFVAALQTSPQPKKPVTNPLINEVLVISPISTDALAPPVSRKESKTINGGDVLNRIRRSDIPPTWNALHASPSKIRVASTLIAIFSSVYICVGAIIIVLALRHIVGAIQNVTNTGQGSLLPDWLLLSLGAFCMLIALFPRYLRSTMGDTLFLLPQGCIQLSRKKVYSIINYEEIESAHIHNKRLKIKFADGKKEATPIDLRYFKSPEAIGQKIVDAYARFKANTNTLGGVM